MTCCSFACKAGEESFQFYLLLMGKCYNNYSVHRKLANTIAAQR